jgi:ABC-type dipeptide/oligopeptide/nickel transport system permease component
VLRFALARLVQLVPTLLIVSLLVFGIARLIPGDPARILAGESATPERLNAIRVRWGLDQPLPVQYLTYLQHLATGDLGVSISSSAPIREELASRLGLTVQLAVAATSLALLVGLVAGTIGALRPYSWIDYLSTTFSLLGVSVPIFWSGLVLILLFAVQLHWLPSGGTGTPLHLILPALSLGFFGAGGIARQTRSTMLEVLVADYIRTAKAKGLTERAVVVRHALQNALIPVVTVVGIQFGRTLGGAILTESVFGLPGVGRYLVGGIASRDYPVIQACILVFATSFILVNLLVDMLYGVLEPRIRHA